MDPEKQGLSTGKLVAFLTAYGIFQNTLLHMSTALLCTLGVVPLYQRLKPILTTLPEVDTTKSHPGELRGNIEVSQVNFRYHPDGPLILKDVSLHVNSGELIAIVGPSGAGKSTLMRLLLGFEMPESGAVYYDGQDLSKVDVLEIRRQLGVVLQNSQIMMGSIYENIVGAASANLTLDDAWEAARMAGCEEDIRHMPMQLHTILPPGGGTLSGGQRQRILIARAVVKKPRMLFFDEATSALDNATQEIVSKSLEKLQSTRIVIAHRLSTIRNADRIYVMDKGRIVQSGTYYELIKQKGVFAKLAKRQMA
jgi:ATP-binding cassette subfamily C protein